jgi:outer membrane murein-binding lipoprotein Lpp
MQSDHVLSFVSHPNRLNNASETGEAIRQQVSPRCRFHWITAHKRLFRLAGGSMLVRILLFILTSALLRGQSATTSPNAADLAKQMADMNAVIQKLQQRVDELEARLGSTAAAERAGKPEIAQANQPALPASGQVAPSVPAISNFLRGTSIDTLVDTYYGYNFNHLIGRVNRLRAYDVLSNSFSLNQATIVFENAPDVDNGKRWGARLDLQFGQATETLQGNAANELRPEVYRNIFQAYGIYVVPVGSARPWLTMDKTWPASMPTACFTT